MLNRRMAIFAVGLIVVVVAGFALLNSNAPCCAGTTVDIAPAEYQGQFISTGEAHLLIDVRTPEEFASGHISGAVNIPLDSLQNRLSEVPQDEAVVVYCRSGNRSSQAARILEQAGYSNIYDLGGLNTWSAQGFPIE